MQHDLVTSQDGGHYDRTAEYLMVIGLNPSTADETTDDPTIRRCIDFAQRWGFGALCMTNLFAWRATKPADMMAADRPVGDDNIKWLVKSAKDSGMILAAWGTKGGWKKQDKVVMGYIHHVVKMGMMCLRTTKEGHPEHPLYVPSDTLPVPFPTQ